MPEGAVLVRVDADSYKCVSNSMSPSKHVASAVCCHYRHEKGCLCRMTHRLDTVGQLLVVNLEAVRVVLQVQDRKRLVSIVPRAMVAVLRKRVMIEKTVVAQGVLDDIHKFSIVTSMKAKFSTEIYPHISATRDHSGLFTNTVNSRIFSLELLQAPPQHRTQNCRKVPIKQNRTSLLVQGG